VPEIRIRACNGAPVLGNGDYVLYWMIAARRTRWNFALDRAVEWSQRLRKPLVIFEALRKDIPWQSDRTRRFVLDGMGANLRSLQARNALYYPYVEPASNEGKGLLAAVASRAAVVVTDEFPCFFLPRMVAAASRNVPVLLEQVDSNGLLPLRAAPKEFITAFAFRRFLQSRLPEHLLSFPTPNPLSKVEVPPLRALPKTITRRWPSAHPESMGTHVQTEPGASDDSEQCRVELRGGSLAAKKRLQSFLHGKLKSYLEARNEPAKDGTSGLSPYLHFGHISVHEVFAEVAKLERWTPERLALRSSGNRAGWWGMSPAAEAFLDQLITWRELGFNLCHLRKDFDQFESLPAWAQTTLRVHASDPRPHRYRFDAFENARTHDPLWNAAQTQLLMEGRIHNYLRMLWGKKILEWTRSPKEALRVMIELNNRYALDGRDPNSYTGIFWCLGRYDHPWGPERPVFGTVRYMSSRNTMRKLNIDEYLCRYAPNQRHAQMEGHSRARRTKTR
jgi:deoxyribodipyrimidine photo-lyase